MFSCERKETNSHRVDSQLWPPDQHTYFYLNSRKKPPRRQLTTALAWGRHFGHLPFPWIYNHEGPSALLPYCREREEGKERERETSLCGCLLHIPYWRPGLQCKHGPDWESKRRSFGLQARAQSTEVLFASSLQELFNILLEKECWRRFLVDSKNQWNSHGHLTNCNSHYYYFCNKKVK